MFLIKSELMLIALAHPEANSINSSKVLFYPSSMNHLQACFAHAHELQVKDT